MRHALKLLAFAASLALGSMHVPAFADPDKDESGKGRYYDRGSRYDGHGHGGKHKEEFWDGQCKVERKRKKDGEYKEERKCRPGPYGHAEPVTLPGAEPGIVITLPPIVIGGR